MTQLVVSHDLIDGVSQCHMTMILPQVIYGKYLVILDVSHEDEGIYRCWVANVAGQVFQDVEVNVLSEYKKRCIHIDKVMCNFY